MEYESNSIPDPEEKSHLRQTLETIEYAIKQSWHNDIDATDQLTELISIQTNILSSPSFQSYFPSENDFQYFITRFTEETITNILRERPVPGKDGDDIALTVLTNYILFYTKFYNDQQLIPLWSKVKFIFNQSANYFSQGNGHQYGNLIHNPKRDITVEQFNTGIPHIKNEFKVGDRCDIYICNHHDKNEICKHNFLRGCIVNVDNDSYTVKTDIFPQEITKDKESCFVFNEGVLTHDWEWRLGLKEYDVVDCYHNGRYRPAMVLSVEDVGNDNKQSSSTTTTTYSKRCYKIGCRILIDKCSNYKSYAKYYDNGDNIRTDYMQNKYIGESFQFDSDYEFYDLRIQQPNTKLKDTKTFQQQQSSSSRYMNANPYFNRGGYTNNTLFPSINTEDEDNIIQTINDNYYIYINEDGSKNYIIGKQRDFSYYYTSLLQLFAKHNGYEDIISILTNDKISNENIYLVFYILNISLPYLHKTYLLDNYTTITQSALKYIDNLSSNEIRNLKKEISDIIIEVISKIQFRLCINNNNSSNTSNNSFNIIDEFTMKIIIKMINSSIFDKRLHGVKLLNDYLKSNKDNDIIVTNILQLMKHNNIIQEIFGVNSHSQIIAKSTDIIAVILERNFLSPDELMLILSGTQKGDLDGKLTIMNILKELSHLFSHEQRQTILCFIYEHIDTTNIKEKEIELICNLSQSSNNNDDVVNAIGFFMGCILKCKVHGDKMNNLLIEKLKDITKINGEYMVQVFIMCTKALKDNVNAVMAYKILFSFIHKIIHSYTTSNSSEHNVIQQAYNDYFKDDNDLLKLYRDNCVLYKSQAKHIINHNSNSNTSSKLIVDGFTHSDNISIRLAFITLFTKRSEFNIIDFLIQLLYIDPVCESDRNDFFKFTEKIFDSTNTISLDKSHYIPIINELFKLFSNTELFKINNITSTSLEVFCITFLYINIQNHKIIINHDHPRSPFTTSTDNEIEHILKHSTLQVRPDELNGFDILWSIIFTSNDDAIASDALKLLQDLYNKNNQSNLLLAKCTDAIKHSSTYDNAFNKYFNIMNKLFIESESNGVPTIRAHCDILKERTFTLKLIYMSATPNETVTVYKNTTLSELKLAIAKHNTCDYNDITLEYNREAIPLNQHCFPLYKILSLLDNDNELIVKLTERKYVDLLDRSGKATAKFEAVLNEWFDTFSEDNERMTAEKIRDFTEKVTKVTTTQYTKPISVDDERVRGLLDRYDHDGKGYITREDFMHFYITAAKDKCSLVWNNILSMGYRENLMKKDEEVEIDVTKKEVYPRYVLGNDKEFLGIVFEVFKNVNDDDDKKMKLLEFVNSLCTNEEMYKEMLMNMHREYTVFDNGNEVVDLYKMHIVESFVEDVKCEETQTQMQMDMDMDMIVKWYDVVDDNKDVNVSECKCKWIDVFYESGQFVKLIAYVCGLLHRLSSENYVESSRVVVMCLNKAVKLLFTFFTLTLNNNNSNNVVVHNSEYTNVTEQHLLQLVKELISFIMNTLNNTVNTNTNEHVDIYTCFTLCISLLVHKPTLFDHIINSNNSNNSIDNISYQLLHDLITICLMSTQQQHCVFFIKTLIQYTSIANDIAHHNIVFYLYSICLHLFKRILHSNNTTTTTNTNTTSFTLFFDYFTSLYEIICVLRINLPLTVVDTYITRYNIGSDEFIMNLYDSVIDYVLSNNKQNQMIITGDLFIGVVKLLIKGIQNNPSTKTALLSKRRNNINIFNELIKFVIPSNDDTPVTTTTTNDNTQTNQYIPLHSITTATTAELTLLNQKSYICKFITALIDGNASYSAEYFINNAHHLSELLTSLDTSSSPSHAHETLSTYYKELMYNQPDTPRGRSEGYVGLKNLGCICYMNSIMQQLYMVPTFRYAILQSDDHKPIETSSFDDNLLHQLQRMYTFLLLSEKEYYNPKLFCHAYRDIDGNPTNVVVQQDSQEFLNAFCDKIETHLKETEFKYIINDVFCGRTCSQVICDTCKHVSHRFEDFYDLTLEVKNINTLNESLDKMVTPEKIDDFNCERCKSKVTITKRTTLATLPNVLIVHLRRFWMNYDEFHTEKINSMFKFPFEINLKKYCIEDIMTHTQNTTNATVYDSDDIYYKEDEYYMYTLKGVTVHMGTADGGHYFSYINVNRDNTVSTSSGDDNGETWLKFNDSHVSKFDVKELPEECFGGSSSSSRENNNAYGHHGMMMMHEYENCQNAYLLIYERKAKTPIRYVYKPQTQFNTVNVVMFDEKTRNAVLKQHDISRKQSYTSRNELTHALTYKVFHDVQKNEHYVYRGFYSLDKKVPLVYYKQVQQTNKQFLRKCNKDKSFHELIKHIENDFKVHVQQHPEMIVQLDSNVKTTLCDVVLNKLFMLLSSNSSDDSSSNSVVSVLNDLNVYFEVLTSLIDGNESNMMKFFAFLEMNSRFGLLATLDKTYMAFIEQLCLFMENVLEKNITIEGCKYAQEVIKLTLSLFTSSKTASSSQVMLLPPFYSLLHKVLKHIDNAKYEELQTHFNIISFLAKSLVSMYNEVESNNNINTEQQQQQCNKYKQCCNIIIECLFNFLMQLHEYNNIQYITNNNNSNNSSDNLYIHLNDITSILTKLETDAFLHALSHLNIPQYANILYFLYCSNRNIIQPETTRILKQIHQHIHNTTYITQLYTILITLLSIKDNKTLEKFICILGYPEINIEYSNSSERIWPLFGYELYKRDDKSMYRYVTPNHVDKEYSLLQLFNNEFNYEMYMKLLTATTEHFGLFKYLYLMPSNAMRFNNYYEEMLMKCEAYVRNVSDDDVKAKMVNDIEEIKKRNKAYEERVVNYVKNESGNDVHEECYELPGWKGYLTEMIPKDIVNENIRKLAEGEGLLFYLFEYETTFIEVDLLKPSEALLHELEKEMNNNNNCNNNDNDMQLQLQLQHPTEEGMFSTKIQKPYPKQNPLIFDISYRGYNEKHFIKQLTSSTKHTNNLLLTFTNPKHNLSSSPSNTTLIRISRFTIINNTSKKGTITFLNKVNPPSTASTPLNYFIPTTVTDLLTPNDYRDCFIIHSFHKHLKHFIHSDTSWSIKLNIDQPCYSSYSSY